MHTMNDKLKELGEVVDPDALNAANLVAGDLPENARGKFFTLVKDARGKQLEDTLTGRARKGRKVLEAEAAQAAANVLLPVLEARSRKK